MAARPPKAAVTPGCISRALCALKLVPGSADQKCPKHLSFHTMEPFLLTQHLSHHLQLLPQKSDLCCLEEEGWGLTKDAREAWCL